MNKKNLEILGLGEGATAEDIKSAYESLRAKYLEERFLDGEAGNNAAKMLTKIETAYQELLTELNEDAAADDGGESFEKVEEYLRADNVAEAQRTLDSFNERNARWHYLQSVVYYRKSWMNEAKKQLEIAIQLEPDNEKYKEKYRILLENINHAANAANNANPAGDNGGARYAGQDMDGSDPGQMGDGLCSMCYTLMCLNCLCNGCCR